MLIKMGTRGGIRSGIKSILAKDKSGEQVLAIAGLNNIGEIKIHDEKYNVLDKSDKVVAVYEPHNVLRVNLTDHEIGQLMKE